MWIFFFFCCLLNWSNQIWSNLAGMIYEMLKIFFHWCWMSVWRSLMPRDDIFIKTLSIYSSKVFTPYSLIISFSEKVFRCVITKAITFQIKFILLIARLIVITISLVIYVFERKIIDFILFCTVILNRIWASRWNYFYTTSSTQCNGHKVLNVLLYLYIDIQA